MMLPGFPEAAPMAGLAGGALIGVASMVMLLGMGRVAGVSGIAARAVGLGGSSLPKAAAWAFVVGLPLGAFAIASVQGAPGFEFTGPLPLTVAGLLVGFGTRLGSGCTSGHGVCGLSRFSQRSIVAVVSFMGAGFATVAAMNALGITVLK